MPSSRRHFLQQAALGLGALYLGPDCYAAPPRTYTNPVYPHPMPDPFVLRHQGRYYAFGTTNRDVRSGRYFKVLSSTNLVDWQELGGALVPPKGAENAEYWAPEVVYVDGTFYLYYSRGGGAIGASVGHQLHVATSKKPEGPYTDVATLEVPASRFTIDAHPYRDLDGKWYLFYARDFTDSEGGFFPGTGLAVDRLIGMTKLAGEERTVMRARHPWTLFEANRTMPLYENRQFAQWHTLEGPFVRRRGGKYYCFYSGSNFLTNNYGVDYLVADHVLGPYSDAGAENGARVLHFVAGHVRGPGHHSHVIGPDGKTEYLVYHAWDAGMKERQMCIDKLLWTPEGPRAQGPTYTPQPVP